MSKTKTPFKSYDLTILESEIIDILIKNNGLNSYDDITDKLDFEVDPKDVDNAIKNLLKLGYKIK